MKNNFFVFLILFLLSGFFCINSLYAYNLSTKLKGRVLLQVESNGEAWYVDPRDEKRHFLGRPDDAFDLMRSLGLGINNSDFDSFDNYAPSRLSGRIILKVEDYGKAYYVNPDDLKMHYLGRPTDAFNIMRELGLGITDDNLNRISQYAKEMVNWLTYSATQPNPFQLLYPSNWTIQQPVIGETICESIITLNYPDGPAISHVKVCSAGIAIIHKFSSDEYLNCSKTSKNNLDYYECPGTFETRFDLIDIFKKNLYIKQNDENYLGLSFKVSVEKNKVSEDDILSKYEDIYTKIFNSVSLKQ